MDTKNEDIDIIMRQTSYSKELALKKYNEFSGSVELVISDYLRGGKEVKKEKEEVVSLNQEIYKQIRDFMS